MATTVLGLKTFAASDPVDYNEVNDNYVKIDNGVKTAMQGRAAHNLLDNSDFRNSVNQRGATSVVENWKYIVDRWVCTNVSSDAPISVNANGITLNNAAGTQTQSFRQYISIKNGTYTVAAKTDGSIWIKTFTYSNKTITNRSSSFDGKGQIYVAVKDDNIYISIQAFAGYSIKVEWAALYEGSYTADTLPAYQPKGYAAELAECMRYYQVIPYDLSVYNVATDSAYPSRYHILFPQQTRITPTATLNESWNANVKTSETSYVSANGLCFTVSANSTGYTEWHGNITLSADL